LIVGASLMAAVAAAAVYAFSDRSGDNARPLVSGQEHVVTHGQTSILVAARNPDSQLDQGGVGVTGTLVLVGNRCVGFRTPSSDASPTMIVWPHGTEVSGTGESVVIRSQGKSVRLGEEFAGGSARRSHFPKLEGQLPRACRGNRMVDVGLNN
jgi:hypothetical protein